MNTNNSFQEERNPLQQVIDELEEQCEGLASCIINRVSWRVIRKIKKQMTNFNLSEDLAEQGLDIFDQMSIFYQNRYYSEFAVGFEDYLHDTIQDEIDDISEVDRLILEHRDFEALSKGEMESRIFTDVLNEVSSIVDNHYYTKKIQRITSRYDLGI